MVAHALQDGSPVSVAELLAPTPAPMVSPTYIVKTTDPLAAQQTQGWQVGGLATHLSSSLGQGLFNLSGGLYFSRETARAQTPNASALSLGSSLGNTAALGLTNNLLKGDGASGAKADQIIFQRLNYQRGGLSLSGNYANVGKDFQGINELKQQVNADDAKLLGLGMAQTGYALRYTGIKGMEFSSNRSNVENGQIGSAENGLSRTNQTNSLAFSLGQRGRLEYSVANLVEQWDPSVVKRDIHDVRTETLKLSGAMGKKSEFSLGQTLTNTLTGKQQTEDAAQRNISLKWNEWQHMSFAGGYTSKLNALNGETNDTLNLDMNAAISPRMQLTGHLANNDILTPSTGKTVKNDLLDLRLNSTLTPTLQLTGGYKQTITPDNMETLTRDQQLTWTPTAHWKFITRLVDTDQTASDTRPKTSNLTAFSTIGQVGGKAHPAQIMLLTRDEALPDEVQQTRREVIYTRAFGPGKDASKFLLQTGTYQLTNATTPVGDTMLAVQLLNLRAGGDRTTVSLGYYAGPRLGAGYLTYRTWGQRNSGNLGIWNATDFARYSEFGGEVIHRLTPATRLIFREVSGSLQAGSVQEMLEYGVEHQIGNVKFQGTQTQTGLTGRSATADSREMNRWKLLMPSAHPLPEWAVNSTRSILFTDGASWGFANAPTWLTAKPTSGMTLEKRQAPDRQTLDQYSLQGAGMISAHLFTQATYERYPQKVGDPAQTDPLTRQLLHLGYAIKPGVQCFGRYTNETRLDQPTTDTTISVGVIGQLSPVERLQLQIDAIQHCEKTKQQAGKAYALEYERKLQAGNALYLKLRLSPTLVLAPQDRVRVEASYRHAF
ncbi:MAG TPA: hypothetical protein VGL77_17820 [Armatimonadota bacterium]